MTGPAPGARPPRPDAQLAIAAPTRDGGTLLLLSEPPDGQGALGVCLTCNATSEQQSLVGVQRVDELGTGTDQLALCGSCIAAALAIFLGRVHVRDGGTIGDLQLPPRE